MKVPFGTVNARNGTFMTSRRPDLVSGVVG
ncbi:hypothetical protein BC739_004237 [Kutzneria viridogrisea]|uniref:Uncharacterized protein n=2 Tax=Kutzneria TaxID=43356 RepID=W5W570_9PSEU|nr:hypothetical protein KALB_2237 [Kutzneria albida DSM 43870]MBA8927031.1 hypothetical protein [Kutzneria viridogrisea]